MDFELSEAINECSRRNLRYDDYLAVDEEAGTLFLTTMSQGDRTGNAVKEAVCEALRFSEPLKRAMGYTTSASGTKTWKEHGMLMSWHYHPDIGLNLSVLRDD